MRSRPRRLAALSISVFALAACADSTSPSGETLHEQRARWTNQAVSDYTYVYRVTGFFINFAGQDITLTVRNDSVVAAVVTEASQPLSPSGFPTIDQLFDEAEAALREGQLADIAFDPLYSFPVRMDLTGPPDASGSVFASHFQPAH